MPDRLTAVAFDVDAASLLSLREALPEWEIEVLHGATAASLTHDWNPGEADLLVVKAGEDVAETLRLCHFLVLCSAFSTDSREQVAETVGVPRGRQTRARRADAPLLVLVSSGQESLRRAAFAAGADSCLVLPVHAQEVVSRLARVRQGNRRERHALMFCLGRGRREDRWRDDGGQG
jgi:DNA-binding NarL/FixJ family response regulator